MIQSSKTSKHGDFGEALNALHFALDLYIERARSTSSKNQGKLHIVRQKWFRYAYFLGVILNRFTVAEQLLGETLDPTTDPAKMAYMVERRTIRSNDLLLEVESFYLISKVFLDRNRRHYRIRF